VRFLQRSLIAVGCLLIATDGFVRGYSAGYSAAAVLQCEGANKAGGEKAASVLPQQLEEIDFSLWSESRIRSFKNILGIEVAEPIALLEIERLGVRVAVFDGTDRTSLLRGAGWIQATTRPTEAGNTGIAGHRDSFFHPLKDIQIGDVMRLTTGQGVLRFRVDETEIVEPEDTHVL
jgi:sortase A